MKESQTGNKPDSLRQIKQERTKPKPSTSLEKQKRSQARVKSRRGIKG